MQSVSTNVDKLILFWFRVVSEDLLKSHRLPLYEFFSSKTSFVAVCHAPKSVIGNLCSHEPIIGMDDKVEIVLSILLKVVVSLRC